MGKILIIEDSNIIRLKLTQILENQGFEVVSLKSGEALQGNFRKYKDFSLMIFDITLPGLSGIELTELLNSNKELTHIPIIFLTGSKDLKTFQKAIEAGAIDYVLKPFDEVDLIYRVKNAIGTVKPKKAHMSELDIIKDCFFKEYDRAKRGIQYFSYIIYKYNNTNTYEVTIMIQSLIRKIDSVLTIKDYIIIILPITNDAGLMVVENKIGLFLKEKNIAINPIYTKTIKPNDESTLSDLWIELEQYIKK
jgi:DNA-binding response OmpR family regulator